MFVALVTLSLAMPADPPKEKEKELPEAAQKELQKLQGKWKLVKAARNGTEHVFEKGERDLVGEFKGRKWVLEGVEKAEIVAFDLGTNPKCLDMKSLETGRDGVLEESIYKLDGDTLTWCFYQGQGKNRPTTFDIPKDKDTILAVLQRVPAEPKK